MGRYHLCQVKRAERPYYITSISTKIYTIEELCFYLQQNVYLIDQSIVNEELCLWIRDELGLKRLYRKLHEQLEREDESIVKFIMPIFKEISYLTPGEYREIQDQIMKIEIQPEDLRRKMKADYLVKYEMYSNAVNEYYQILKERNPGNLGIQFYASILNNMAVAYAKLFLFEEAADCLWQSYGIVRSNETWKRYLSLLPLYLSREEYARKLKDLSVPKEQIRRIEEQNREIVKKAMAKKMSGIDPEEFLQEAMDKYGKSSGSC
ncbi:MAG: hypothetical protein UDG86_07275 [Lachnospiraceae bacterium]|nr:hypothetical protein [Lachnospiraceae bacterium]